MSKHQTDTARLKHDTKNEIYPAKFNGKYA